MGQVSAFLRRTSQGHAHWCPGCEGMHLLPSGWTFNGDVERPTFEPSFLHQSALWDEATGKSVPTVCHYVLTAGVLDFCADCTHALRGPVPLPPLPPGFRD